MSLNRILLFIFAVAAISADGPPARSQSLLGNSIDGVLYDVNIATGAATNPRSVGTQANSLMGIAFAPNGALYGLTTFLSTPANALIAINPVTGTSTTIGGTGLNLAEGDLAFDPTSGALYGISHQVMGNRQLFAIDVATGAGTIVGTLGGLNDYDFSAMTFASDGTLYMLGSAVLTPATRLLTVNKSTAAITSAVTLSINFGATAGMDFHPLTGALYVTDGGVDIPIAAGTDNLYTLNSATGALTLVGPTGLADGLAGLAFVVPEPAGIGLASAAGVMVFAMRRSGNGVRR